MTKIARFNTDGQMIATAATKGEIAARKAIEEKLKAALAKFNTKHKKAEDKLTKVNEEIRALNDRLYDLRQKQETYGKDIETLIDDSHEDLAELQEELEDAGGKMLLPKFLQSEYGFLVGKKSKKASANMRKGVPVFRGDGSRKTGRGGGAGGPGGAGTNRRRGGGSGFYGA